MKHLKILEEIQRTPWAMMLPSIRAMLSVLEDDGLSADNYNRFHSLAPEAKIDLSDVFGRQMDGKFYTSIRENVGFLMVDGPIVPRATMFSNVSGLTSLDALTAEFKALESDPSIDTIAFLFDSPGGIAKGLSDFDATVRGSSKKTISFAWMAASAAYWMASATDRIVSPPDGMSGSIGTVLSIRDTKKADEKRGIRNIEIVSSQSPKKRLDPDTDEGRAEYQELVDDLAAEFIGAVAKNRGIKAEHVIERFGQGKTFVAHRALDNGMIDAIQTADEFAKSIIKSQSTYQISTISATADQQPKMEVSIMDVKTLKSEHRDVYDEIVASAKAEERDNLKAIEAIAAKFDDSLPAVKAAAVKAIDANKYAEGATIASVSSAVLDAVAGAQVKAVEDFAKPRRDAADVAQAISEATLPQAETSDPNSADEDRIKRMLAASESEGRIK